MLKILHPLKALKVWKIVGTYKFDAKCDANS